MDILQFTSILISFVLGIVSSGIWDWLKGNLTFRTNDYPDIRGEWVAKTKFEDGREQIERIVIKSQFMRSFNGSLTAPNPDKQGDVIELDVEGYLVDKYTIRYSFKPKESKFSDVGVGILRINNNYKMGQGASVSVGLNSDTPIVAKEELEKVNL